MGRVMGKGAHVGRFIALTGVASLALAACSGGGRRGVRAGTEGGDVTLEFAQWWEPELPDGAFRELMDQFEEENPASRSSC